MKFDRKQSWLTLALLVFAGCGSGSDEAQRAEVPVFVSIVPLEYFVERVGGPHVSVRTLVGPGQSPATYEPTAKQMTALADSKVLFTVGVPIETQLIPRVRSAFPSVEIVDVREGMPLLNEEFERLGEHSDIAADREHETDPHVWLSPRLAQTIAGNISRTLSRIDPPHATEYDRNYRQLADDLSRLDAELTQMLAPLRGKELFVFHPAYAYFANEFGLKQVAIETGGVTPGSRRFVNLIAEARSRGVKAIFVQPQFSPTAAETVARSIGAETVELDPLARDYIENLWDMAIKIHSVYAVDHGQR